MGDYTSCELHLPTDLAPDVLAAVSAAFQERTDTGEHVLDELRQGHSIANDFRVGSETEFVGELRELGRFPFVFWTSPKFEYLGTMVKHSPERDEPFIGDCTDDGTIVLDNQVLLNRVREAESLDDIQTWMRAQLGLDWDFRDTP